MSELKPPQTAGTIINQDNRNSSGNNVGQVNVYNGPVPLVLSNEQESIAKNILKSAPGRVNFILPSPEEGVVSVGVTTQLGKQIFELFEGWDATPGFLGSAIPSGIRIVGDAEDETANTIVRALKTANIPFVLDPNGWAGPGSLSRSHPAPATVTVNRSVAP